MQGRQRAGVEESVGQRDLPHSGGAALHGGLGQNCLAKAAGSGVVFRHHNQAAGAKQRFLDCGKVQRLYRGQVQDPGVDPVAVQLSFTGLPARS